MKRIFLNLAVAVLTFFVGATASMLHSRGTYAPKTNSLIASTGMSAEPLKITMEMHACGPRANYHTFDLSDGTRVSTSCEGHSSQAAAARALQRKLSGVPEIVERAPNLDENGHRVGDKVVAINGGVVELETSGNALCSTAAASLEHLRWFERR